MHDAHESAKLRYSEQGVIQDVALLAQAKFLTGIQTTRRMFAETLRVLIHSPEQSQARDLRDRLSWEGNPATLRGN